MNKTLIFILFAMSLLFVACQETEQTITQTNAVQPVKTESADGNAFVKIQNFAYEPEVINIKKGESVTWKNYDSAPHDVSALDFKSPLLNKDKTFSQQFDKAGVYDYYCSLHPSMTGKVVVE